MISRPIAGDTEDIWLERRNFATLLLQHHERKNIFFLDETGFKVEMRSHYGRSKKGKNAEAFVPHILSRNISVLQHYLVLELKIMKY